MREIKLNHLDELFSLTDQLGVITYLQELVRIDQCDMVQRDAEMSFAHECAGIYLWMWQHETVLKLRQLLTSEDFARKIDSI